MLNEEEQLKIEYTFYLDLCKYKISIPMERFEQVFPLMNRDVKFKLINKKDYIVKSKVRPQTFQIYLEYFSESKMPEINLDNAFELYLLNEEFGLLSDFISENEGIVNLSCLKYDDDDNDNNNDNQQQIPFDRSQNEAHIALNLDYFIDHYPSELSQIKKYSLINIFNHPQRNLNDTQKALDFIRNFIGLNESSNQNQISPVFLILLESLNGDELDRKTQFEFISKREENFGFCPHFSQSFYRSIEEKMDELELIKSKLLPQLQKENIQLNNTLNILFEQSIIKKNFDTFKIIVSSEGFDINKKFISNEYLNKIYNREFQYNSLFNFFIVFVNVIFEIQFHF